MSDKKVRFLGLVTVHRELQDEFVDIFKTPSIPPGLSVAL